MAKCRNCGNEHDSGEVCVFATYRTNIGGVETMVCCERCGPDAAKPVAIKAPVKKTIARKAPKRKSSTKKTLNKKSQKKKAPKKKALSTKKRGKKAGKKQGRK